jgi:two-component system nitrate/nitrite response regulator NarL
VSPPRVFLVADVSLHRAGLVELLASDERVDVVGSAASVDESLGEVAALRPDVAVLDVTPPDRTRGVSALTAAHDAVRVVVCAVPETEEDVIPCAEAGAAACLPHETPFDELVATIRHVASGESVASPRMTAMLMKRLSALATERATNGERHLTAREREILALIDEGLSNKDIAARLCIEVPTVKNHVHNILEKLQVRGRYEAAARVRNGNGAHTPKN